MGEREWEEPGRHGVKVRLLDLCKTFVTFRERRIKKTTTTRLGHVVKLAREKP